MPGAEAFRFDAPGDLACLLVHGFTGSAHELRDLGLHLADSGVTAHGLLLPGHGTRPEQMARHRYRDWIGHVEAGLDELLAEGKRVFLCGLSMGGTLSLNVAARRHDDPRLRGIVSLAAPLRLVDWRLSMLPIVGLVKRWHSWGAPDIKDSAQWERHVAYRRFHIRALVELLKPLKETRGLIADVRHPLLIVHSRVDNTVPPFNAELIAARVGSREKRVVWLENCYHVVTLDYDSEQVHREVVEFIRRHA
jgi:carboxylesterase